VGPSHSNSLFHPSCPRIVVPHCIGALAFHTKGLDSVRVLLLYLLERPWVGTKALKLLVLRSLVVESLERPWIKTKALKFRVY